MPPVNRKNTPSPGKRPSPAKRRPLVAGTRTPGADRDVRAVADPVEKPTEAKSQPTSPAGPPSAGVVDAGEEAAEPLREPRSRLLLVAFSGALVMLVAAVALTAVSWVHSRNPKEVSGSTANVALINAPETQQVGAAALDILQKAYSYSYTTIDTNLDDAVAVMTPEMGTQHRSNFGTIRKTVTEAKTTTKATVVSDAVKLLDGDRAEVIAFVVVTGDNGGTALQPSGYRFTASLLRSNGKWLLSGLTEA